jgi:hypothetical protein
MRSTRLVALCFCAALLGVLLAPGARADEWNKKTIVTVNVPIEVSGHVLTPGTYIFKLEESLSYRQFVQIWSGDEQHFVATVLTIPTYRDEPTDRTVLRLGERAANAPPALVKWFYPGDVIGFEFLYPHNVRTNLSAAATTAD